uniref:Uncharacterized protein n=1 Tax=Amphimedon queenslandica TaxID=400682 RepID=A0A1X7V4X6_AMPQE
MKELEALAVQYECVANLIVIKYPFVADCYGPSQLVVAPLEDSYTLKKNVPMIIDLSSGEYYINAEQYLLTVADNLSEIFKKLAQRLVHLWKGKYLLWQKALNVT